MQSWQLSCWNQDIVSSLCTYYYLLYFLVKIFGIMDRTSGSGCQIDKEIFIGVPCTFKELHWHDQHWYRTQVMACHIHIKLKPLPVPDWTNGQCCLIVNWALRPSVIHFSKIRMKKENMKWNIIQNYQEYTFVKKKYAFENVYSCSSSNINA